MRTAQYCLERVSRVYKANTPATDIAISTTIVPATQFQRPGAKCGPQDTLSETRGETFPFANASSGRGPICGRDEHRLLDKLVGFEFIDNKDCEVRWRGQARSRPQFQRCFRCHVLTSFCREMSHLGFLRRA